MAGRHRQPPDWNILCFYATVAFALIGFWWMVLHVWPWPAW